MPDEQLPQRTLKTSFWLAALFILIFGVRGQPSIAFGLAIGSALGLFSLASLIYLVPPLFSPGPAPRRLAFGFLAFLKLPFYAVVIYFAMSTKYVHPVAVFVGVACVPVVLVLKVLGYQLLEKANRTAPGGETCRS